MAITISQQPTSPNAAYTELIYVITGSISASQPQFRYVLDIYESGSSDRIERLTTIPNATGTAEFNISKTLQSQLSFDKPFAYNEITGSVNSFKSFDIKVGDSYGTSTSSSITIYADQISSSIDVWPATVNSINEDSYNFPSGAFMYPTYTSGSLMTKRPTQDNPGGSYSGSTVMRTYGGEGDRHTVSFLNYGTAGERVNFSTPQVTTILSGYNAILWIYQWGNENPPGNIPIVADNTGSGLINVPTDMYYWLDLVGDTSASTGSLREVLNEREWTEWTYLLFYPSSSLQFQHTVYNENNIYNALLGQGGDLGSLPEFANEWFNRTLNGENVEKLRFAFINEYGVYDYWNHYGPVKKFTRGDRTNYTKPNVDYSSAISTYDIATGGEKTYYYDSSDTFEISTYPMYGRQAKFFEDLLESPSVFIQQGDKMIPVNITTTAYTKADKYRLKGMYYTFQFTPSNQTFGDFATEEVTSNPIYHYRIYSCTGNATGSISTYNIARPGQVIGYTSGSYDCWEIGPRVTANTAVISGSDNFNIFTGSCYDSCEECGQYTKYYNISACEDFTVTSSIYTTNVTLNVGTVIEYVSSSYECWTVYEETSVENNNFWTGSTFSDCESCGEYSKYYIAEACENSSVTASFRTVNFTASIGDVVKLNTGGYECYTVTSTTGTPNTGSYVGSLFEDCTICRDADRYYQAAACLDGIYKLNFYVSSSFQSLQAGDVIYYPSGITASAAGTPYVGEELTCWTITDAAAISSSAVFFTGSVYKSTGSNNPCQECGQYYAYLALQSCDDPGVFRSVYWDDDITAGTVLYFSGSGVYEGYDCWTVYGTTSGNSTYLGATTQSFANCASCSLYTP